MAIVHTAGFRPRLYDESAWYDSIAELLAQFDSDARFPTPDELTALYRSRAAPIGLPALRFVASVKPRKKRVTKQPIQLASLYEGRIVELGEVPTRVDDWHDFFNALAFITFPRAKHALHSRQYSILKRRLAPLARRLPNARTREQDALSLFDEGGLIVAAPEPLAHALGEPDDGTLAEHLRRGALHVIPFGHALYEHMAAGLPCPLATVHVLTLPDAAVVRADGASTRELLEAVDLALATTLEDPLAFQVPSSARGSSLPALRQPDKTR